MDSLNNPREASVDEPSCTEPEYATLRVRIYDNTDDEDELSLAPSSETFDSSSEHMAALSDADSASLMESVAPTATFKKALMKLNELNSGIISLDTSILEDLSEADFRLRMMEIAVANNLSLDDDVVHDILNALLPLVRAPFVQKRDTIWDLIRHAPHMPVAKLTVDYDTEKLDDADIDLIIEVSDADQSENTEPYSAHGLPICVADDINEEQDINEILYPSIGDVGEQAELEHLLKAGDCISVLHCPDTDTTISTYVHIQQPVRTKLGARRSVNAASFNHQIPESIAFSANTSSSRSLSTQEGAFNKTSELDPDKGDQNGASKDQIGESTVTASGVPMFNDVGFVTRPTGRGHIESGIVFSRPNNFTEIDDVRRKLQLLRLKLVCLAIRLQQSTNDVVRQVLYRLDLADCLRGGSQGRVSDLDNLRLLAEGLEAGKLGHLEFQCTVLVLGKSGVGKSATINSLFGKFMSQTDAFKPATMKVKEILGTVSGLTLRVIDTPGFLTSCTDMKNNLKILSSVKCYIKRSPPDVVLYVDRLDLQCRDYGELPLFKAISDTLGKAIWYDTIVVFTHGLSGPPDDANNAAEDYEMFVARRLCALQDSICHAAGNMQLRNLHSIVENHAASLATTAAREVWQPQVLLLCFASKILAEADTVLRSKEKTSWGQPQGPSLPFFAPMTQSQVHLKVPNEQAIHEVESNSDEEVINLNAASECEDFPFYRRLTREELVSLDKKQREIYHEEPKCRQQLMNARARRKELKKGLVASAKEALDLTNMHYEKTSPAVALVTIPDIAMPLSFGTYNPTHRCHSLNAKKGFLIQPVQSENDWDHDIGYNGQSIKKAFLMLQKLRVSVSGKITKDKKDTSLQLKCATSFDKKSLHAGLNIHTLREDVAYSLHGEIKFNSMEKHKATCGLGITMIGDTAARDMKLEDFSVVNMWSKLAIGGGVMTAQQEGAYGGYKEAFVNDNHFPISPFLSTVNWQKILAIISICQVRLLLGQTVVTGRVNLNNVRVGKIRIRANSSDQLQMAFIGILPFLHVLMFSRIAGFLKSFQ
ncbi:hypothetical protein L7F22_008034 [Adiantum nelumboides]|nr:hypothetical protein [Adiantum nelumboides]